MPSRGVPSYRGVPVGRVGLGMEQAQDTLIDKKQKEGFLWWGGGEGRRGGGGRGEGEEGEGEEGEGEEGEGEEGEGEEGEGGGGGG